MHQLEVTAWTARLGHLLVTERYGFSHARFPGDVPAAARARTIRHLARQDPAAIATLIDAWPEFETLPIWPDLHRVLIEQPDLGPPPGPMGRRGFVDSPETLDESSATRLRRLLRRLAYLHDQEELQGSAFGLLTLSEAWRCCLQVPNPLGNLLEAYLDSQSATIRLIVRYCLRSHRVIDEWRTIGDRELFERFAAAVERQPDSLAAAPPEQIERLQEAGALSAEFARKRPLAGAESADDQPLPLARVPSGHFEIDARPPALLTMSPLLGPV